MADTTYTFSTDPTHQSRFKHVNDPTKPGWGDVAAPAEEEEDVAEEDVAEEEQAKDHLFGTRIREVVRTLRGES